MKVQSNTQMMRRDIDDLKKQFEELKDNIHVCISELTGNIENHLNNLEGELQFVSDHIETAIEDIDNLENHECEEE
jgi:archaellum component FlaC